MDFEEIKASVDAPYPEPLIPYPNPAEGKKLMNDYAGRDSEVTAIMQYSYQSFILKKNYPEFSKKLEEIAICEMRHFEILGCAISDYGSFPVIGGKNTFWNGSFVSYVSDLIKLLEGDISGEELAIVNYKKTILEIYNDTLKLTIRRIIEDEELHIKILKLMLEDAKKLLMN